VEAAGDIEVENDIGVFDFNEFLQVFKTGILDEDDSLEMGGQEISHGAAERIGNEYRRPLLAGIFVVKNCPAAEFLIRRIGLGVAGKFLVVDEFILVGPGQGPVIFLIHLRKVQGIGQIAAQFLVPPDQLFFRDRCKFRKPLTHGLDNGGIADIGPVEIPVGVAFMVQLTLLFCRQQRRTQVEDIGKGRRLGEIVEKLFQVGFALPLQNAIRKILRVDHHLVGRRNKQILDALILQPLLPVSQNLFPVLQSVPIELIEPHEIGDDVLCGQIQPFILSHHGVGFRRGLKKGDEKGIVQIDEFVAQAKVIVEIFLIFLGKCLQRLEGQLERRFFRQLSFFSQGNGGFLGELHYRQGRENSRQKKCCKEPGCYLFHEFALKAEIDERIVDSAGKRCEGQGEYRRETGQADEGLDHCCL